MKISKKGIIVDVNAFHKFKDINHEDSKPIHQCIENGKLRLVYGNDEKSLEEINDDQDMKKIIRRIGKKGTFQVDSKKKKEEIEQNPYIGKEQIKSNDFHILAVALTDKNTRLLFTGDKKLQKDFKNKKIINNPKGKIYQDKQHSHLLPTR